MIAIIDYGLGNLKSVQNALAFLGAESRIVSKSTELKNPDAIIIPGVGAFGNAMQGLEKFRAPLFSALNSGTPFLGICLGLQVLFEESEESPGVKGLSFFSGKVSKIKTNLKLPQIGWNKVSVEKDCTLFKGIQNNAYFYYVNSFVAKPADSALISATSEYGEKFPAAICKNNVFAVQFHPEKSGEVGLQLLKNFLKLT